MQPYMIVTLVVSLVYVVLLLVAQHYGAMALSASTDDMRQHYWKRANHASSLLYAAIFVGTAASLFLGVFGPPSLVATP